MHKKEDGVVRAVCDAAKIFWGCFFTVFLSFEIFKNKRRSSKTSNLFLYLRNDILVTYEEFIKILCGNFNRVYLLKLVLSK